MSVNRKLTDEELVALICDNDQELYRELVGRYEEKLFRYARYICNDEEKAKDIVQNTFIKAFINLKGFNRKKKFSSWIYRITHNEAINFIRRHKSEQRIDGDLEKTLNDDRIDIKEEIERKDQREIITENISKLPLRFREVLELYFLEEKSYEEISDILRMPIGTVGTNLNRGKKILKNMLASYHKN